MFENSNLPSEYPKYPNGVYPVSWKVSLRSGLSVPSVDRTVNNGSQPAFEEIVSKACSRRSLVSDHRLMGTSLRRLRVRHAQRDNRCQTRVEIKTAFLLRRRERGAGRERPREEGPGTQAFGCHTRRVVSAVSPRSKPIQHINGGDDEITSDSLQTPCQHQQQQ